jgi:hypothetical protein
MRAIFNIHSDSAAKTAGWRAREIHIYDIREATLEDILKATPLADGLSVYDYIIEKDGLKSLWLLYVNGIKFSGPSFLKTSVKDSTQIHLMDNPLPVHHK